jgi:Holliday junction resolvase-like predicted endonuclease
VVVVEVRSRGRGAFSSALESVSVVKRRRLLEASTRLWRGGTLGLRGVERVRIDVAAVTFDGEETRIEYVPGALVGGG